jgi:hypothetical protein
MYNRGFHVEKKTFVNLEHDEKITFVNLEHGISRRRRQKIPFTTEYYEPPHSASVCPLYALRGPKRASVAR